MEHVDLNTIFWATGLVGVACYLASYSLLQAGVIRGASVPHTLLNMTAASLVLISLAVEWNMSSALIQISWITISLIGLTRLWVQARRLRFTDEEHSVRESCLATMPSLDARRVLDLGVWLDAPKGYVLTEEGMPVEHFYFVAEGGADVRMDGLKIAEIGRYGVIGEMGCLTQSAASATTVLNAPTRLFRVRSDDLARLVRRSPDLRPHLEYAFAHATRQKLLDTNIALRDALHRVQYLGRVG